MKRREFLKMGMFSLSALAAAQGMSIPTVFERSEFSEKPDGKVSLFMRDAFVEMITLERVYSWVFATEDFGPSMPGLLLMSREGQRMQLSVTNLLEQDHAFLIPGVVESGPIQPGKTAVLDFRAPAAGTYLYYDPMNAPINRTMGLNGVMMVMPRDERPLSPYGPNGTRNVQALFGDLGKTQLFEGEPWKPERTFFWIFHEIDPSWNLKLLNGEAINPELFVQGFLPRYFLLTGKTGFHSTWDPDIAPHGTVGQPAMVRMATTGMMTHSIHTHGEHMYVLAKNATVQDNVIVRDTVAVQPLETVDVLIPFHVPPDVPPGSWPPKEEGFPMLYIVHDHIETGQTADGGNYPHGITTHIVYTGPLGADVSGDRKDT